MDDASKALKSWVTFGGCVTVVLVLYWAQTVLVPIALAVLVTFVLTPPVAWLQRWVGRVAAVLLMVTLVFSVSVSPAGVSSGRWTIWTVIFRATARTCWPRSPTCAGRAKTDRSRSCRRRSKTSRPTSRKRRRLADRPHGR
ncbi:MAG: AI-2E family transporter [Acidobacteriota bacterium]